MRGKEYGIDTISYVSKKTMNRFQYIWVAMIGELYELIVEYLENGSNRNLLAI